MSAILSAILGTISLLNKLATALQQKKDRDLGAKEQQLKDATDELQAIRDGTHAAADPDALKRVRDQYEVPRPS